MMERSVLWGMVTGLVTALMVAGACASDSESSDVKRPWEAASAGTHYQFQGQLSGGRTTTVQTAQVGTVVIGGVEYTTQQLAAGAGAAEGALEVATSLQGQTLTVAAVSIWAPPGAPLPADTPLVPQGPPLVSGSFDEPAHLNLGAPIGVPQTLTVSGTAVFGDPANPVTSQQAQGTVEYTRVADDVVAQTAMGPVAGVSHYTGTLTIGDTVLTGAAWYHPELGAIAMEVDFPPPTGLRFDFLGSADYGGPGGTNTIQAMAVLTPERPNFSLSTYDVAQTHDADKDTHAKMLLELRWADADRAATTDQPLVTETFRTVFGVFPSLLVPSPVSLFHPEENGLGYTFWVGYVDQAAKNEPINGISYAVDVSLPNSITHPVLVTARIHYARTSP
jgi:hypothetical protein